MKRALITLCCALIGAVNGAVFLSIQTILSASSLTFPLRDTRDNYDFWVVTYSVPCGALLGGVLGLLITWRLASPLCKGLIAVVGALPTIIWICRVYAVQKANLTELIESKNMDEVFFGPTSYQELNEEHLALLGPTLFWSLLLFAWGIRTLWRARNTYSKRA